MKFALVPLQDERYYKTDGVVLKAVQFRTYLRFKIQ